MNIRNIKIYIQEHYWRYAFSLFLILLLFSPRYAFNYILVSILEPQIRDPIWNPLVAEIRAQHPNLFFSYGTAKEGIQKITWGTIFIFSLIHIYSRIHYRAYLY